MQALGRELQDQEDRDKFIQGCELDNSSTVSVVEINTLFPPDCDLLKMVGPGS